MFGLNFFGSVPQNSASGSAASRRRSSSADHQRAPKRRRRNQLRRQIERLEDRQLLAGDLGIAYGGIADGSISDTNSGLILALDTTAAIAAPLHNDHLTIDTGVNGTAFTADGRLFIATNNAAGGTSTLQEIDPRGGTAIGAAIALPIRVDDMATDLTTDTIYALGVSGGGVASQMSLYTIDISDGSIVLAGHVAAYMPGGLAIDAGGKAYVTAKNASTGAAIVLEIDPSDGSTLATKSLVGAAGFSGSFAGLGYRNDGVLVGSDAANGKLFQIDAASGAMALVPLQDPVHGVFGDLAFSPNARVIDQVYSENFSLGDGGFTIDNTGRTINGLWHRSPGRRFDGLLNHTPIQSFYYGAFETAYGGGHYVLTESHRGTITSPLIQLPEKGTTIVSFSYLLDTRPELDADFVSVSILVDGVATQILSRQDGSLPETTVNQWLSATHDISQFNGQEIQIKFLFDTGEIPRIDPEGWYVDDIEIINTPPPAISGYKWNDLNADGIWDDDESGLNGWQIYLDANGNGQYDAGTERLFETRNDGTLDGAYWFDDLDPGTYIVREIVPEGWKQSFPGVATGFQHLVMIDPAAGICVNGAFGEEQLPNFGNYQADISGYKWHDVNFDGAWDAGEVGLNGWEIYLDLDNDGTFDEGIEPITTTAFDGTHDGAYSFTGLAAGSYTVREIVPEGWKQRYPGAAFNFQHVVAIDPPNGLRHVSDFEVTESANFGNWRPQVIGYKWDDIDGDGVWDDDEPGLNDWIIYVDRDRDGQLDADEPRFTTQNDGEDDGAFWFDGLEVGDHLLREILPDDWVQTYPGNATDWGHEITISTDPNAQIIGRFGEEEAPNFGNSQIDILGHKWNDVDGDGVWDDDESGLNGWTIYLDLDRDGNFDSTGDDPEPSFVTTNHRGQDGVYYFSGLEPGEYLVREVDRDGWQQTYPVPIDSVARGHVVTIDPPEGIRVISDAGVASVANFGNTQVADLKITKTALETMVTEGDFVIFEVTAENVVPEGADPTDFATATGIVVTDRLPDGLEPIRDSAGAIVQPTASIGNATIPPGSEVSTITWSGFDLAPGESATMRFAVRVKSDVGATQIENVATGISDQRDPDPTNNDDTNPEGKATLDVAALVQFILPIGTLREGTLTYIPPVANAGPTISGFQWNDLNSDGIWDAQELGVSGFGIFLDINGNGVLDPEANEPLAVTDADGRYTFTGLADGTLLSDGTYIVRRLATSRSEGTLEIASFPEASDFHEVEISGGVSVAGTEQTTESPNFGSFEYVPYLRPADDLAGHLTAWATNPQLAGSANADRMVAAVQPWQHFGVTNTTDAAMTLDGLNVSGIDPGITVVLYEADASGNLLRDIDGLPVLPAFLSGSSEQLAVGETKYYIAFYDPAVRVSDGAQVTQQSPDWLAGNQTPTHNFAAAAEIALSSSGTDLFRVRLVGGSTFDSDIVHSGNVDLNDFLSYQTVADAAAAVTSTMDGFDFTSDMNARCPNGAEQTIDTCTWSIAGSPNREIALGDLGTLNVEFGFVRPVWLDLQPDVNQSGLGTGNQVISTGETIGVAPNAVFAAVDNLPLESLTIQILGPVDPSDILSADGETAPLLTFNNLTTSAAQDILRQLQFSTSETGSVRQLTVTVTAIVENRPELNFVDTSEAYRTTIVTAKILILPTS
ncbi:Serine-aspartate repeat-containing protein F precursor [Rosistilla carotiformis]|uniref:Serine-aspartate repeat-containing protein F n=1 Tax=Rosistilla carotiformis TaxID=2528017 RepID=A0A518JXR6_9BACT|nr:SdrD B-like domain-containing protein [Rosistilla carotiformis]QDV70329.1 Serine-aspartate repeat-containing protein F precursor [Rosistilla carotiformis]